MKAADLQIKRHHYKTASAAVGTCCYAFDIISWASRLSPARLCTQRPPIKTRNSTAIFRQTRIVLYTLRLTLFIFYTVNINSSPIGVSTNLRFSLGKLGKCPFGSRPLDPLKKSEDSKFYSGRAYIVIFAAPASLRFLIRIIYMVNIPHKPQRQRLDDGAGNPQI